MAFGRTSIRSGATQSCSYEGLPVSVGALGITVRGLQTIGDICTKRVVSDQSYSSRIDANLINGLSSSTPVSRT